MTLNLDDLAEPEDDLPKGWRFDPANPPDEFNVSMIRRMSIDQLKDLSEPNEVLNPAQQASFDRAYHEWWDPLKEKINASFSAINQSVRAPLNAALAESVQNVQKRLRAQLTVPDFASTAREKPTSLPKAEDFVCNVPADTYERATAEDFEHEVADTQDQVALLTTMATLMKRQYLTTTPGGFRSDRQRQRRGRGGRPRSRPRPGTSGGGPWASPSEFWCSPSWAT